MDNSLIPFFVILTLVLVTIWNGSDTPRGLSCIVVLWATAPGYFIYETELYYPIVEYLGSYGYQSATPLLAIITLSFIRDKLNTVLMCLFSMLILANGYFWWQEGNGHQIQEIQQAVVWIVFAIEVALMLSPRLTNGIHGVIQRFDVGGMATTIKHFASNRIHLLPVNSGEGKK